MLLALGASKEEVTEASLKRRCWQEFYSLSTASLRDTWPNAEMPHCQENNRVAFGNERTPR